MTRRRVRVADAVAGIKSILREDPKRWTSEGFAGLVEGASSAFEASEREILEALLGFEAEAGS